MATRLTAAQHKSYTRAAIAAGYRSTSDWVTAALDREAELLEWSDSGAGCEPTPVELDSALPNPEKAP